MSRSELVCVAKRYTYLPRFVRQNLGITDQRRIPYYTTTGAVLLVRPESTPRQILAALDLLRREIKLSSQQHEAETKSE